jgi:hypothetical protein
MNKEFIKEQLKMREQLKVTPTRESGISEVASGEQSSGGTKYDSGKPRMDLLVPEADEATAKVFTFGAGKYGDYNWQKGINYSRLHAALRRHVSAWARGVDLDDESGLPHLAHARCCLDMLLYFHETGRIELDDRPSTQSKGESK